MMRRKRCGSDIDSLLERIVTSQEKILKKIKHMEAQMVSKEELEAGIDAVSDKITGVSDKLADFVVDFKAAVDELKRQIAAGGVDLAPAMAKLTALSDKIVPISDSLAALDTEAEGISGTPTP